MALTKAQQQAVDYINKKGTQAQKDSLKGTQYESQIKPSQPASFIDKAKNAVTSVVDTVKKAITPTPKTPEAPATQPTQQFSKGQQQAIDYINKKGTQAQKDSLKGTQYESQIKQPPQTDLNKQMSDFTAGKPTNKDGELTTPPTPGEVSDFNKKFTTTTPTSGKKTAQKTDTSQFYFGEQAKRVEEKTPGYLAQRDQGIAQGIMADPRLTDANIADMVRENLIGKWADKMEAKPWDVEATIKRLTDMITASRKQWATNATLSSKTPAEIWSAIADGSIDVTDSYLTELQQSDPARYQEIMKAKKDTQDANYSNSSVSKSTYTAEQETPTPPDYDTLLKESGLDEASIAASQVDMQEKYNQIYTPELTELGKKVSKFDTDLALLDEKKYNLRKDIEKRLEGTGATSRTVDLLMYDEQEGINREIRTLTLQRNQFADEYKQASSSADAQWKAVQDGVKAEEAAKRKVFEKKYGIAKDQYDKERKLFEKKLDQDWDVEKLTQQRKRSQQDMATKRSWETEDMATKRERDVKDMYTKQALDTEQMKLKYWMDYDLKKEMRTWDMEDKLTIMGASTEQQMKLANYKAQLDKKTWAKISPFKTADWGYMFMNMDTMQPVWAMDADGNFSGGSATWTNSPTGVYSTITVGKKKVTMDEAAILPFQSSLAEMKAQGLGDLIIADSYRTNERQKQLYSSVSGTVAKPGTSKHEVGMAVDVYSGKDPKTGKLLPPTAAQTKILNANGWKQTAGAGDLWHFEYVGTNKSPTPQGGSTWSNPLTWWSSTSSADRLAKKALAGQNISADIAKMKGNPLDNKKSISDTYTQSIPSGITDSQALKWYVDGYKQIRGSDAPMTTIVSSLASRTDPNTLVDLFTKSDGLAKDVPTLTKNIATLAKAWVKLTDKQWLQKIRASGLGTQSKWLVSYFTTNEDPDDDFLPDTKELQVLKAAKENLWFLDVTAPLTQ